MNSTQFLYHITRLIWYGFYLIETALLVRFALMLFGASPDASFTRFVYGVSQLLIAPFEYVFAPVSIGGGGLIDINALLAVIIYWIIAWAGVSLILLGRDVDETEARHSLRAEDSHI